MIKKILFLVGIIGVSNCQEPVMKKLNEESYDKFIDTDSLAIVLIYEPWCKYSEIALEIFKKILKDDKFLDLKVPVGFLDTHLIADFKEYKGIQSVPKILIYKNRTEIEY